MPQNPALCSVYIDSPKEDQDYKNTWSVYTVYHSNIFYGVALFSFNPGFTVLSIKALKYIKI